MIDLAAKLWLCLIIEFFLAKVSYCLVHVSVSYLYSKALYKTFDMPLQTYCLFFLPCTC
jgi:hypothetical protein